MAFLQSRVLTSLARRGFALENSAAVGAPQAEPQATLADDNLKYSDQQFGKVEHEATRKKFQAEKVDCDDRICTIKSWKNVKNSSS